MPEPLEFQSVQSLQTALKTIKTSAGFHYTLADTAVKLDPNHEIDALIPKAEAPFAAPRPFIVLDLSQQHSFDYSERTQVLILLPFTIVWVQDVDMSDDASLLQTYFRGLADVETAIASDTVQIDTREMAERDGGEVWALVSGVIRSRRGYGAPNG